MTENTIPTHGGSLALLTDLYELTMAYGFWKAGIHDHEAVYNLFYRSEPFGNGFSVACGLAQAIDWLDQFQFAADDLAYLAELRGNDGAPLFAAAFLEYLGDLSFGCDVDAIPEGTVVFAHEPLVRVRGPILHCQVIESALLNIINFQTLIATKSARICHATRGEPVLEFGLRRAQGIDGSLSASRAAYVGGCAATSNVLAGKRFGIPVRGTHAHSWVMCFDSELQAFKSYADAMPNNCVFLVDTYSTLEGVRHAVSVASSLREHGHEIVGIRLDSGDLASLSIEARRILDDSGFPDAAIVASNDLDELEIDRLKQNGATIGVWGVGTRLATGYDQPALGGVYKLTSIRHSGGDWQHKIKLSEQEIKVSNPGILQVRRFRDESGFTADMIFDEETGVPVAAELVELSDPSNTISIPVDASFEDLLVPIYRSGERVYVPPGVEEARQRTSQQLAAFEPALKHLTEPSRYTVGLEARLHDLKSRLIREARATLG